MPPYLCSLKRKTEFGTCWYYYLQRMLRLRPHFDKHILISQEPSHVDNKKLSEGFFTMATGRCVVVVVDSFVLISCYALTECQWNSEVSAESNPNDCFANWENIAKISFKKTLFFTWLPGGNRIRLWFDSYRLFHKNVPLRGFVKAGLSEKVYKYLPKHYQWFVPVYWGLYVLT